MSKNAARLGVMLLFTACAPTLDFPSGPLSSDLAFSDDLESAPNWVTQHCRAHWTDPEVRREVLCAVGSTPKHPNRVAARETAIARARAAIARSLTVTIESWVLLTEGSEEEEELRSLVHQLSSTSLRGVQTETTWRSPRGEVHALVSLGLGQVQHSVRKTKSLPATERESLAERAAKAFAEMDAAFENESSTEWTGDVQRD